MKLTSKMIELLSDLNAIEATQNKSLLVGDGLLLRKNLLALYRRTEKQESHALIIRIMAEGGYPWFAKLAKGAGEAVTRDVIEQWETGDEPMLDHKPELGFVMSEDEFLDMLPANGHFH